MRLSFFRRADRLKERSHESLGKPLLASECDGVNDRAQDSRPHIMKQVRQIMRWRLPPARAIVAGWAKLPHAWIHVGAVPRSDVAKNIIQGEVFMNFPYPPPSFSHCRGPNRQ